MTISKFDRKPYTPEKTWRRQGSMDVLNKPSRIENTLFYPDGRIERNDKESTKDNDSTSRK